MKNNLREIREKKNLSQQELADLSGISRVTISKIETQNDINIKNNTILAISKALNMSACKIFPIFK